uniref:protein-tyrosine-phosphatase n=1 Tax=Callorhinchus milii TaxID=7868 RepID=A0A4W3JIV2_CALMI
MTSRFRMLGGRTNNMRAFEIPRDKHRSEVICNVHFLNSSIQSFKVNKQDAGQVLLDMAYNHLGLTEREYFSLQFIDDSVDCPRWLEPNKPIRKQLKGGSPCSLNFRVRFFVTDPSALQQEQTSMCVYRLSCPHNIAVVLASYAVQAELGEYNPPKHHHGYIADFCFGPDQNQEFETKVMLLHKQHSDLEQSEAELYYLSRAKALEFYGVELHKARNLGNLDVQIGISSGGLGVYRNMARVSFYPWVNITKISFKRKRFFIQLREKPVKSIVGFNMLNYRACKILWKSCVEHHTFFQAKKPLLQEKKILAAYFTVGHRNQNRFLNYQFCRRVIGGMVWNPVLRKSLSVEQLETRSLPSRSPPLTPDWPSPRLRHDGQKPRHSSVDNLASEMAYITESEEVFYNYKVNSPINTINNDMECSLKPASNSWQRRRSLTHSFDDVRINVQSEDVSHPLEGVDSQFLKTYDIMAPTTNSGETEPYQYYYDKVYLDDACIILIRMTPDEEGKFGFNLKADTCTPKLIEGDQILLINGRDISEHTHDQVVMFIKASRESHSRELLLLVRRKETIPGKKPGMAITCAKLPQNMDKNRYKDVLPYDVTRVVLDGSEDYINANYVNMEVSGTSILNRYIACQGPLPHTCPYFWQTIWNQQSSLVVMLTTLTERGRVKCHQYWPDLQDVCKYGNFQVTCHTENYGIAYVFREMMLTNLETGEERDVCHLQYVTWPDHGVPDDSTDFFDFVTRVRQKRIKRENEPVIVHCSAGIGRTGVLVAMETATCLIENNQPVYPLDIVRTMRDQRAMMVQTSSQYKFVCEAILRVYEEGVIQPSEVCWAAG